MIWEIRLTQIAEAFGDKNLAAASAAHGRDGSSALRGDQARTHRGLLRPPPGLG